MQGDKEMKLHLLTIVWGLEVGAGLTLGAYLAFYLMHGAVRLFS